MKTFDILDHQQEILGTFFLEAAAGTGKTFTIEHLLARLILHGVPIERILVVTFTKAATQEIRKRTQQNLALLRRALSQKEVLLPWDYVQQLRQQPVEQLLALRRRLEQALATIDQAQIFTIHSFCWQMLSECALIGRHAPSDPQQQMRRVVADFFRCGVTLPEYNPLQVERALCFAHRNFLDLLEMVASSALTRSDFPPLSSNVDIRRAFIDCGRRFLAQWKFSLPQLRADYQRLQGCYRQLASASRSSLAQQMEELAGRIGQPLSEDAWQQILQGEGRCLQQLSAERRKKQATLPPPDQLHYPGIFAAMAAEFLPLITAATDPEQIVLRMARDCRHSWAQKRDHEGWLSFDDLLQQMDRALQTRAFCQYIEQKYQAVLIDEFQDIDLLQWRIFRKICYQRATPLACTLFVGDPKQSIYAFRGADLYTYLEATAATAAENRYRLPVNHRSSPQLVAALNAFFSTEKEPACWMELPHGKGSLPLYPMATARQEEQQDGRAMHWLLLPEMPDLAWEKQEALLFAAVGAAIAAAPSGASVALLVKDRFQAQRLQRALAQQEISSFLRGHDNIYRSKGFALFMTLYRFLLQPRDRRRFQQLLVSPLFGYPLAALDMDDLGKWGPLQARLIAIAQRGHQEGLARCWPSLWALQWEDLSLHEHLLRQAGPLLWEELTAAYALCLEEQQATRLSGAALLDHLRASQVEQRRPPLCALGDRGSIPILTIHMSKGLEFDVVIPVGLMAPLRPARVLADDRRQRAAQAAESLRLCYVALTRARQRLYLPYILRQRIEREKPRTLLDRLLLHLLPGAQEVSAQQIIAYLRACCHSSPLTFTLLSAPTPPPPPQQRQEALLVAPSPLPRRVFLPRPVHSFSSLHRQGDIARPAVAADAPDALPAGVETGILLHRLLEALFASPQRHLPPQRQQLIARTVQGTLLAPWQRRVEQLITALLQLPLPGKHAPFSLQQIAATHLQQEMPFLYAGDGHYVQGVIDLVFEHQGLYYIVDWKSNRLPQPWSPQVLSEVIAAQRYDLQARLYATALQRLLATCTQQPFAEIFGGAFVVFLRIPYAYPVLPGAQVGR